MCRNPRKLKVSSMTSVYSIEQARAKLGQILKDVAAGTPVTLTRNGVPAGIVIAPGYHGVPDDALYHLEASYATWADLTGYETIAEYVREVLCRPEHAPVDLEGLEDHFRLQVEQTLHEGIRLVGNEFIGPYRMRPPFDLDGLRREIETERFRKLPTLYAA